MSMASAESSAKKEAHLLVKWDKTGPRLIRFARKSADIADAVTKWLLKTSNSAINHDRRAAKRTLDKLLTANLASTGD